MDDFISYPKIENIGKLHMTITQKIHGCLASDTWITMADWSHKRIKDVVECEDDQYVIGYENSELKPVKILTKFNNGLTDNWLTIKVTNNGGNRYKEPRNIQVTPNHQFFVKDKGYIPASELCIDDTLIYIRPELELTFLQEQVLIGKMLGDGSLSKNSSTGIRNFISFSHKKEHEDYLNYTSHCLGLIAGSNQKDQISGYGTVMCRGRTKSLECIEKAFSHWIIDDIKVIPHDLCLTPISMAFWYMDDGSLLHSELQEDRLTIATNAFNVHHISIIERELNKFNINIKIQESCGLRVRLNINDADKFFTLIAPYIPEIMQYKLPVRYRGLFNFQIPSQESQFKKLLLEQKVIKIFKLQLRTPDKNKYDLETETHNYFADSILVHNSNAQVNITKQPYDLWRVQAGSRTRWLTIEDDNYGFAKWVQDNKEELIQKLGVGRHYGEWCGKGINTGEGLSEKMFVLFDWWRYEVFDCDHYLMKNVRTVPVLYKGKFSYEVINDTMTRLKERGSALTPPGFYMKPEGIVIDINGQKFKKVFDEEEVKWNRPDVPRETKINNFDATPYLQPLRLEKLLLRDESYTRNYPDSLPEIVRAYIQDLIDEKQIPGSDEEVESARKLMARHVFNFIKWKFNEINK